MTGTGHCYVELYSRVRSRCRSRSSTYVVAVSGTVAVKAQRRDERLLLRMCGVFAKLQAPETTRVVVTFVVWFGAHCHGFQGTCT